MARVPAWAWLAAHGLLSIFGDNGRAQSVQPRITWPTVNGHVPAARYHIGEHPRTDFGTAAGPDLTLLSGVVGAVRLEDGTLAVGDAGNTRVLFISGASARAVGRRGDGPGEFRIPLWLGHCGPDAIGVFDAAHNSMTFLSAAGRVQATLPLPAAVSFAQVVLCTGRDAIWVLQNQPTTVQKGERFRIRPVLMRIANGAVTDTLATEGSQEYYAARNVGAFLDVPLGEYTLATAGGGLVYLGHTRSGLVAVFDSSGARLREFTIRTPRRAVTHDAWTRVVQERIARHPFARTRAAAAAVLSELAPPADFPQFDSARADARGNLWVRTFDNLATSTATWVILNATGRAVAAIALPRDLDVRDIGSDYIVGVEADRDGVEHVVLYDLRRG